jgi:hypothetical protein
VIIPRSGIYTFEGSQGNIFSFQQWQIQAGSSEKEEHHTEGTEVTEVS